MSNMFDFLRAVLYGEDTSVDPATAADDKYIIARYVSMVSPAHIVLANYVANRPSVTPELLMLAMMSIPKTAPRKIDYIKRKKSSTKSYDEIVIAAEKYGITPREMDQAIHITSCLQHQIP